MFDRDNQARCSIDLVATVGRGFPLSPVMVPLGFSVQIDVEHHWYPDREGGWYPTSSTIARI